MAQQHTYSPILTQLGLSPEQAELYQALLDHGALSATDLSNHTSVQRTYVYSLAEQLSEMGLVIPEKKGRTTRYRAASPDVLLSLAEAKRVAAEQAQSALDGLLPVLKDKYAATEERPVVTYYEGLEGVKKVYMDKIHDQSGSDDPILALVETSKVDQRVYDWVTTTFVDERIKHGIHVKSIVASGEKTDAYISSDERELRESKVIDSAQFPFEHEINVYGDKLAVINHKAGEPLMGIIIHKDIIANTFRSWFDLTWKSLKKQE